MNSYNLINSSRGPKASETLNRNSERTFSAMSKKLFSTERWKRYMKARQASEDRNAKRKRRRRIGVLTKPHFTPAERRRFYSISAPTNFSMVDNPTSAIAFLNSIRFYSVRHNLTLDLSQVSNLTSDAVAVLVATLAPLKRIPVHVRGNLPKDKASQLMLIRSGFFDHYESVQPLPRVSRGLISRKKSQKVQPDLARDLIHFGYKAILGRAEKCTAAYRVLIESMLNTHNHASTPTAYDREPWWVTVYADETRKRLCFTFVDTGVGIFKSVKVGKLRTIYRLLRMYTDADMLRDMLHGKVESSTGISYRGKGLPAINRLADLNRIKSLVIIANDVYANVSLKDFRTLSVPFRGTMLYWETEVQ